MYEQRDIKYGNYYSFYQYLLIIRGLKIKLKGFELYFILQSFKSV